MPMTKHALYLAYNLKLYKLENIEEFENEWSLMITKFNLKENNHLTGFMITMRRSESINSCFSRIFYRHVLNVFLHKDCFEIPTRYLPLGWLCFEPLQPLIWVGYEQINGP
ncbi:hypothetical protein GQ457_06G009690 [Hibiscus cannabinus]